MSRRFAALCLAPALCAGVVFLRFCNPTEHSFFPRCPFYVVTGLKCPGCGTMRAIHAALNGRFLDAIALNPILVIAVPLVIVLLVFPGVARSKYVGYGVFAATVSYWIIRNLV